MEKLQNIKHKVGSMVHKKDTWARYTNNGRVNFGYQRKEIGDSLSPPAYNSRKESVLERGPNIENYRSSIKRARPSLDELHEERVNKKHSVNTVEPDVCTVSI